MWNAFIVPFASLALLLTLRVLSYVGFACTRDTMNIAKLKNKAEGLVTQLTAKDECEKRVLDAMSNHKYSAPRSLLNEVAEDTFSHERSVGFWDHGAVVLL